MGQEAGVLVRDQPRRLPDAEPRRLALDDPCAEHHALALEVGQRCQFLVAARLFTQYGTGARLVDRDVRALAAEQGLGNIPRSAASSHGPSRWAGSRFGWPGLSSQRIASSALLESSIFQAGSTQQVVPVPPPLSRVSRTWAPKRSVTSHSHG